MTDQRKDEMPDEIWASEIQVHGMFKNMYVHQSEPQDKTGITRYVRADLSPPVPDDVAASVKNLTNTAEALETWCANGDCNIIDKAKMAHDIRIVCRAASAPSAEVMALRDAIDDIWPILQGGMTLSGLPHTAVEKIMDRLDAVLEGE